MSIDKVINDLIQTHAFDVKDLLHAENPHIKGGLSYLQNPLDTLRDAVLKSVRKHKGMPEIGLTFLNEAEHSGFLRDIYSMAETIGMKYKPVIAVLDEMPSPIIALRKLPSAAGAPLAGIIILSKSMFEMAQSQLHLPPSNKLRTIIAHEISHLHFDRGSLMATHFGSLIAPSAGMVGLALYNKAKKRVNASLKDTEEYTKDLNQQIHVAAEQDKTIIDKHEAKPDAWHADPDWQKGLIDLGRYLAVGAASYAAALLLSRQESLRREFHADKIAVQLTGMPEAFKAILKEITDAHHFASKNLPEPKSFGEYFSRCYRSIISATTHAHPPLQQRLSHIDRVAAEMGFGAAGVSRA